VKVSRRPCASRPSGFAFAGFRFRSEVIVVVVRWYLRYGLSYRDVEELLVEPGVEVDQRDGLPVGAAVHSTARGCRQALPAPTR
jgi:hypothetical protein